MASINTLKRLQLRGVKKDYKLEEKHFNIISKYVGDIFSNECVYWKIGTNIGKDNLYIIVKINSKKKMLHRVLYTNYVDNSLDEKSYLKHTCGNPLCLCLKHLVPKIRYKSTFDYSKKSEFNVDF
jgi:hypothetical protein